MTKCSSERVWALMRIRTLLTGVSLLALMYLTPLIIFAGGQTPSGRGLAAKYTDDEPRPSEGRDEGSEPRHSEGLVEEDPNVIIFTDFESDVWLKHWSGGKRETVSVVNEDKKRDFRSLQNKALRIKVPKGEHYGASIEYEFKKRLGSEPEEIYFRYYLRFGNDWDPARGGKLPGIGGTYGRAGWGGRPSNGRNGWSARGLFKRQRGGKTPVGYYCYHADMKGRYGSNWIWDVEKRGYLENNRWYCIEQYVKMNTPGKNDGILRGWVDGQPAFEKTDVRMRDINTLRIETVWLNVYLGGSWVARSDHHLYIDNIVIAHDYIGPIQ
jgi:hypothetical protein